MFKHVPEAGLLIAALLAASPALGEEYDIVKGTDGDDVIFGDLGQFSGKDILETEGLHVTMQALGNKEIMEIGRMLEGENGIEGPADNDDVIYGNAGNDIIFAQGGNDYIDAGPGKDIVFAGSGNDIIIYDPDNRFVDGGSGIDVLVAGPGAPSLRALKEKEIVRDIEILLVIEKGDTLKGWPGIRIVNGKAVLDPTVWKTGAEGTGLYVSRSNPESRLEVDSSVDVVWSL